jgi:hypothetical protein
VGTVTRYPIGGDASSSASAAGFSAFQLFDPMDMRPASARQPVTFPSPYADGGDATLDAMTDDELTYQVHPCVLYVPEGWRGSNYWAVTTPYPDANSLYENPCIYRSDDGVTWEDPGTNPIVPAPGSGYNSDTFITLSPDKAALIMVWRDTGAVASTERVRMVYSLNGTTWSTPVSLVTGTAGVLDFMSPSLNWVDDHWVMHTHNSDAGGIPFEVRTSEDGEAADWLTLLTGTWSAATTVVMPNPRSETWWHSDIRYMEHLRSFVGIAQDDESSGGHLYWIQSHNGINFVPVAFCRSAHYKTGWCMDVGGGCVNVYIGQIIGGFKIMRELHAPGRIAAVVAAAGRHMGSVGSSRLVKHKDTFTRSDTDAGPGTPEIGNAYTADAGTFGISTNRLYVVGTGNTILSTDIGCVAQEVSMRFATLGTTSVYLMCGMVDTNNRVRVGPNSSGVLQIQPIVAGNVGTFTSDGYGSATIVAGDVLTLRKFGVRLEVYVNDRLVNAGTVDLLVQGTKIGIQGSGATPSIVDDLVAIDLG